jgi:hypothetical protein
LSLLVYYPGTFELVDTSLLSKPSENFPASEEYVSEAEIYTPEIENFKRKLLILKHKLASY